MLSLCFVSAECWKCFVPFINAFSSPFLHLVIMTEYVAIEPRVCVCVCVCVCLSVWLYVCVISTAQTDEPILMKFSTNHLIDICQWHISRFFKVRIWWRHGGHFVFLRGQKLLWCMPVFAIENQQDRLITSGYRENRVWQKLEILAQKLKFSKSGKQSVDFY